MTKQAEGQRKLHELDRRLQRWQCEHPVQAWAVALCIAAIFLVVVCLLVKLLPGKTAPEFSVIVAPVSRAVRKGRRNRGPAMGTTVRKPKGRYA